ncbi:cyclic-di-AMP receptor [Amygdalobacter nucleatus]|uniref:cyclic-di-AMP receptor n=1 Tax=Amygdalobacter nucleatus TaxID=3029274 RepID=UPI0027A1A00E|nr:cyclic-di-AMP receptor [Amygdalobacter nucleatus]WEG36651.1 cyclic-di-AMP receptor [Amygdalobacter nucleatus]
MSNSTEMKLVYSIVHDEDSPGLLAELNSHNFSVTKLNSTGGFLRSGNTTLITVVPASDVPKVLDIIRKNSSTRKVTLNPNSASVMPGAAYMSMPVEVTLSGATVFVTPVEYFEKM